MSHIFANKVSKLSTHAEQLCAKPSLSAYLKCARKLAETDDAVRIWHAGEYKDYTDNGLWSATYFGFAFEYLVEKYLQYYGPSHYNLRFRISIEDTDSTEADVGIDHYASTLQPKIYKPCRKAKEGSPVYIQSKATLNFTKEYMTNDGSRLPNFYMAAQAKALIENCAYQARYIIVTSGSNLHYKLENSTNNLAEVINYKMISKHINNNNDFFNTLRDELGVATIDTQFTPDVEGQAIALEIEESDTVDQVV